MNKEVIYIFVFIISVFISSVSQILLKKSANEIHANKLAEYFNFKVILAYIMFFASTLITIFAYKYIPLSFGPILEFTGCIFVVILGSVFLKEKINRSKLMGMLMIVLGIIVFSLKGV
ncbi:EamA family transporter [Propionispira raffinosivorans]|uniref:EamA family transporter n=1 Tax=Propionispira raffinosivorans TaxID=86959 RepID=UPI000381AF8D|nr:EamA family transporter [Propionispira raffinosivorans]